MTVSGPGPVLAELAAGWERDGVWTRVVGVDYASHSPQVDRLREELLAVLAPVAPRAAAVPFYSAVTGELIDTATLDAGYWFENLRRTVCFEQVTRALISAGHRVFIEVSPHPVLTTAVAGTIEDMVLRNSSAWSSNPENVLNPVLEFAEPGTLAANLVLKDPPEHTRLRSLFNAAFLPRVIQRLRPRVISIVDTVLDSLQDEEEADIAADVGFVVALSVMAELFDVGVEGAELFLNQPTKLLRYLEVGRTLEDFEITVQSAAELTGFLLPLIEKRRREPGEDLLSALASAEGLTTDDILSATMVMFTAGGMATGAIIANATLALLNQPDQLPALMADPAQAAEELLRMEGTSKRLIRTALVDHDICGHRIPKGRVVMVNLPAANRDLRRAPDADRMDLTRKPLPHLTFGVGPHYCLGAAITRLELTETLVRLFTRFPDLSLTDREPVWLPSTTFRWLLELPVRLR